MFNQINQNQQQPSKRSLGSSNYTQLLHKLFRPLVGISLVTAALGLSLSAPSNATEFYHHENVVERHHCVYKKVYVKGKHVVVKYWYDKYGKRHPIKSYIPGHYVKKKVCR